MSKKVFLFLIILNVDFKQRTFPRLNKIIYLLIFIYNYISFKKIECY